MIRVEVVAAVLFVCASVACSGVSGTDLDGGDSPDGSDPDAMQADGGQGDGAPGDGGGTGDGGADSSGDAASGDGGDGGVTPPPCDGGCGGGLACCSDKCVNELNDPKNCNGCGVACTGSKGACSAGACVCSIDLGTCTHSPCTTGAALSKGCDPDTIVTITCNLFPSCCTTAWDATCVSNAETYGGLVCTGC